MNRLSILASAFILCHAPSLVLAAEEGRPGSVDFAFDGGTIKCEFGTKDDKTKRSVAFIVHPASVKAKAERKDVILTPSTIGSTVLIVEADGKRRQLDREAATKWAKERISEMAVRRSSVAENAFVATVMYTLSTGTPVRVWANDGVELLESGNWSGLFNPAPRAADNFPDGHPFSEKPTGG